MWKRLAHLAFWLGASLYFGGLVTLGVIAAPAIFETAHSGNLSMPAISPPLEMWKQVGGEIFGNILNRFVWVEVISLVLLLVGIGVPLVTHRPVRRSAVISFILWLILAAVVSYDSAFLRPKVWTMRDQLRGSAITHVSAGTQPSTQPWPERDEFETLHDRSEMLGRVKVYVLLGLILLGSIRGLTEKPLSKQQSIET